MMRYARHTHMYIHVYMYIHKADVYMIILENLIIIIHLVT